MHGCLVHGKKNVQFPGRANLSLVLDNSFQFMRSISVVIVVAVA